MSGPFFDGKPSLGWLRLSILFASVSIAAVSMLVASWHGEGRQLRTVIMMHVFAVVFSLPFLMIGVVRFWYPALTFDQHDGRPFRIGRFGRTCFVLLGLAIFVGLSIRGHVVGR